MAHNNPWFLITSEEIIGILVQLQSLRQTFPDQGRNTIEGIAGILNNVRDRRP